MANNDKPCPHCGYCPACKRTPQKAVPYPFPYPVPYVSPPLGWWWPPVTITTSAPAATTNPYLGTTWFNVDGTTTHVTPSLVATAGSGCPTATVGAQAD